jgi:hypothetical protein
MGGEWLKYALDFLTSPAGDYGEGSSDCLDAVHLHSSNSRAENKNASVTCLYSHRGKNTGQG